MTKNEEKEIIRVCGESYSQNNIPAFIRDRDRKNFLHRGLATKEEMDRLEGKDWAELHGARQDENGEWIV